MSLDAMQQALEALELWEENLGGHKNHEWPISMRNGVITIRLIPPVRKVGGGRRIALQAAERVELSHKHKIAKEMLCAAINQEQEPRQWQGLTDAEIKAPIQRAMQYFGYDPTQYSLGGAATIGFLGLVKEIEAKLKEKNT